MAGSSTARSAALHLRPTGEADLDYVVAAEAAPDTAPFLAPSPREEHAGFMADPAQRHLIAEAGGERVGFALLRLHPAERAVELRRLAVTEPGQGHGRAMLRQVKEAAFEELGAHRLWLDVKPFNDRARALYRSEGFVEEGLLRDALLEPDGSFQDLVVMSILRPEWAP
ncbi:MAG: GNAT family protein [Solirubrobacteraceae bacterium]